VEGTPARRAQASRTRGARAAATAAATAALLAALQGCDAPAPAPHALTRTSPASARSPVASDRGGPSSYPASHPVSPSPAPRQNPLGTTAASYVASRSGTVVAAVYDVAAGQTWTLGPQHPQAEASIVKLDILETLYAKQGNGSALAGSDQSLAQQMMEDSDNAAATSLWNAVGGPGRIKSFNTAAGLTHTRPSSCVTCPGFAWPGWGLTTTTPADQIALLRELIEPSTLLTDAQRQNALEFMENVTPGQRWGVTGGVPPQATVALKNGWLPLNSARTDWQINSIGWVKGSGRDYLMAVLTTGNPTEQYGIETINRLSAMVWGNLR
jgi:beta-lactamase class A